MNSNTQSGLDAENLRKRNVPIQARSEAEARNTVLELNAHEERTTKEEKDRKTFGRTPDGTGRTSIVIMVYIIRPQASKTIPNIAKRFFCELCFEDVITDVEMQSLLCLSLMTWCPSCCLHQSLRISQIC